jgi:hypothetical protein
MKYCSDCDHWAAGYRGDSGSDVDVGSCQRVEWDALNIDFEGINYALVRDIHRFKVMTDNHPAPIDATGNTVCYEGK